MNTFLTLDGVMQAPGGPEEDPRGGFKHGGWSANYWDDLMGQTMDEAMSKPFDILLGRRTYEIFAAHWPYSTDDPAEKLNNAKKYVASTTLKSVEWNNSTLIKGSVPDELARLKSEDGPELQVHGSGQLIQTLIQHDLVDVYRLWTFPILLGKGRRLFAEGTIPAALRVTDSKTSKTGVVITTYERAGEIDYGSFAPDKPSEAEMERRERLGAE